MPVDREQQDRRRKAVVGILATTPARTQIEIVRSLRKLSLTRM